MKFTLFGEQDCVQAAIVAPAPRQCPACWLKKRRTLTGSLSQYRETRAPYRDWRWVTLEWSLCTTLPHIATVHAHKLFA